MKKILSVVLLIVMLLGSFSLVSCGNNVAGKYEVAEIFGSGLGDVEDYDFWYVELNKDGTFTMKFKYKSTSSSYEGTYEIDEDGNITVFDANQEETYFVAPTEKIVCKDGELTCSINLVGTETMKIVFKRK